MAATLIDVKRWIKTAKEIGATHIISVCDCFDWEDYPVYIMPNEDIAKRRKEFNGHNIQKINEIINIEKED